MHQQRIVVSLMALFTVATVAFGATGDQSSVKGMITSRTGETLIVKSADGNVTVVLSDETKTKDDKGLFGQKLECQARYLVFPTICSV